MNINNIETNEAFAPLRDARIWCVWYKHKRENGRIEKVPCSPITGRAGGSGDRNTYGTFAQAASYFKKHRNRFKGIGIGLFDGLTGIDIDGCINAAGELSPTATEIMDKFNVYTEKSPSGHGIHMYCYAPGFILNKSEYTMKRAIEVYVGGQTDRFLTVTGDVIRSGAIDERYTEVCELYEKYLKKAKSLSPTPVEVTDSVDEPVELDELDDEVIRDRMLSSASGEEISHLLAGDYEELPKFQDITGKPDHSAADLALCNHLAFFCGRDAEAMDRIFRSSGLMRDKWNEQRGESTYGELTIQKAIDGTDKIYSPDYRSPKKIDNTPDVQAAERWLVENDAVAKARYSLDDIGAGFLLADFVKPFARYVPEAKSWYVYGDGVWRKDVGGVAVAESAKSLSLALCAYASKVTDDRQRRDWLKFSGHWCNNAFRRTTLEEAKSVHIIAMAEFDARPELLNCENGTYDLSTGKFRAHDPDDRLTRKARAEYNPTAQCPRWLSFIAQVLPDEATRDFLQRWTGYSLSGYVGEEKLVMLYGATTRNGKSTFVETVAASLGDYACSALPETFGAIRKRDGSAPSEDVARLRGRRWVPVSEPDKSMQLDTARIKALTGGDTIAARFLGENSFEFKPEFHLVFNTNSLPAVNDMTLFDSDRVLVVPFEKHFSDAERDPYLKQTLTTPEALSAVLNWILEGYTKYKQKRLIPSARMCAALGEYRQRNDKLQRFIDACLPEANDSLYKVRAEIVYRNYVDWCYNEGLRAESQQNFLQGLELRGVSHGRGRPTGGGTPTTIIYGRSNVPYDLTDLPA